MLSCNRFVIALLPNFCVLCPSVVMCCIQINNFSFFISKKLIYIYHILRIHQTECSNFAICITWVSFTYKF